MSDVSPLLMVDSFSEESGIITSETTESHSNQSTACDELDLQPLIPTFQSTSAVPAGGTKVKVDQGFKIQLRADRESLRLLFESLGYGIGKHHWKPERWLDEVTKFSTDPFFRGLKFTS